MNKVIHSFFLILACLAQLPAQHEFVQTTLPPSPEASSLGKYIEVPVSHYTGIPQINIPLGNITQGDLNVAVSLSYHSAGNKVQEIAPWSGLGWSLMAGGLISRVVRGVPDDKINHCEGFSKSSEQYTYEDFIHAKGNLDWTLLSNTSQGIYDTQPDQYFFNFNGYSGRFYFDWDGNLVLSTKAKINLEAIKEDPTNPYKITAWKVTTEQGTIYNFEYKEFTHVLSHALSCVGSVERYISSWHLSSITDPNQENSINFEYQGYELDYGYQPTSSIRHGIAPPECGLSVVGVFSSTASRLVYQGLHVKRIYSSSGNSEVQFIRTTSQREDMIGPQSLNNGALSEVIFSNSDQTIKEFGLQHDYSTGRLTLKHIHERGPGGQKPPYSFTYNTVQLPQIDSYAIDHWGYYNGIGNQHPVPGAWVYLTDPPQYREGANREPIETKSKAGILEKITYPMGGFTEFVFEQNEYGYVQQADALKNKYKVAPRSETAFAQGNGLPAGHLVTVPFTISSDFNEVDVSITYFGQRSRPVGGSFPPPYVKIKRLSDNFEITRNVSPGEVYENLLLSPGDYELHAYAKDTWTEDEVTSYDQATITINWQNLTNEILTGMAGGGLRIKEIKQYAFEGDPNFQLRSFEYTRPRASGADERLSSGVIYAVPNYVYSYEYYTISRVDPLADVLCPCVVRLSSNKSILGTTEGSHIGYRNVTIKYGANGENGKTELSYTSPYEFFDEIIDTPPFVPPLNNDFRTGLLKHTKDFKIHNASFYPVRETFFEYDYRSKLNYGFVCDFLGGGLEGVSYLFKYSDKGYARQVGHSQLVKSKQLLYSSDHNSRDTLKRVTEFVYDVNLQNMEKQIDSLNLGQTEETYFYYPEDIITPNSDILELISKNMLGEPVEIVKTRRNGDQEKIVSGSYKKQIKDPSNNKIRLAEVLKLNVDQVNNGSGFILAKNNNGYPDPNHYEKEVSIQAYDEYGNVEELVNRQGVKEVYLWAYNMSLPVAHIVNAEKTDVAFSDFESINTGNWTYTGTPTHSLEAHTGAQYYKLNTGLIQKAGLNPIKKYLLSWWTKGNTDFPALNSSLNINYDKLKEKYDDSTGWTYQEYLLAATSSSNDLKISSPGNAIIDGLRLHPVGSQVTTYTYIPGLGVTSVTDANNVTTYYDYDGHNQLELIRDNKKSILEHYQYTYKNNE